MTFSEKLRYIAKDLGTKPQWLLAVMKHESGLNPRAQNRIGCVGLIQFCPETAAQLGYTPEQIKWLSATEQLDLVHKYLKPYTGKLNSPLKVFLAVFYPYALNKINKPNYIIGSEKSIGKARIIRNQNKAFDVDNDGFITIKDMKRYVKRYLKSLNIFYFSGWTWTIIISIVFITLFFFAYKQGYIKIEK